MKVVLLILSCVSLETGLAAQTFTRVVAGNNAADENSSSLAPFSYSGSRYQQVYANTEFPGAELGVGGLWISNIAFRVDASGPGWQGTYSSIQIHLSTTQTQPNSLSPVFANNVGPDDKSVFDGSWNGTVSWPASPGTFGLRFDLSQGFFYNPAEGNLLLDIRNLGNGIFPSSLDALQGAPAISTSVFSSTGASSGTPDALALVTRLGGQIVPIPEPSTYALFVLGAGVFLFLRKARWQ
jgi:hypothetical protein